MCTSFSPTWILFDFFFLQFSTFRAETTKHSNICEIVVLNSFLSQYTYKIFTYHLSWIHHIHFQHSNCNILFDAICDKSTKSLILKAFNPLFFHEKNHTLNFYSTPMHNNSLIKWCGNNQIFVHHDQNSLIFFCLWLKSNTNTSTIHELINILMAFFLVKSSKRVECVLKFKNKISNFIFQSKEKWRIKR